MAEPQQQAFPAHIHAHDEKRVRCVRNKELPERYKRIKRDSWSVWITNHRVDNRKYLLENNHKVVIDSRFFFLLCNSRSLSRGGLLPMLEIFFLLER